MHQPPPNPHRHRIPIIPTIHPLLHPLPPKNIHRPLLQPLLPHLPQHNHLRIPLHLHPIFKSYNSRPAPRRQIQRFLRRQLPGFVGGLQRQVSTDLNRVPHVLENRRVEPARDICAETNNVAFVEQRVDGTAPGCDRRVTRGIVTYF